MFSPNYELMTKPLNYSATI